MKCLSLFFILLASLPCYVFSGGSSDISQASYSEAKRLLLLDGDDGTVACRVYGTLMSATIPRFSHNWTMESATRSLLRMKNLTAVRGPKGASMVGPIDYFGNLEDPHLYFYTIEMAYPPIFHRRPITDRTCGIVSQLKAFDKNLVTVVKAEWISGKNSDVIEEKQQQYNVTKKHLRQSLFLYPGLLEIDRKVIQLKYFDPRGVDLSSFKARLVDNTVPFQITKNKLPAKDDYRLVSYLYEPGYADWQVKEGSGLFLEKHCFSQTITPITPNSRGFVALARMNEKPDELEIIGIQIPYGFTLVIEDGCIHGDTTLNGFFMMGMTSDHTTMGTADTVFLKYPQTKENVQMVLTQAPANNTIPLNEMTTPPYVIYTGATAKDREAFKCMTSGKNFIFTPFSREFETKTYLSGILPIPPLK